MYVRICIYMYIHTPAGPQAPTIVSVERTSATEITLHWTPDSQDDVIDFITHYTVNCYPLAYNNDQRVGQNVYLDYSENQTEVVISNLSPKLRYVMSVAASTEAGIGEYSNSTTVECE